MNLQCLVIDDEPPAQKVLEKYIFDIPNLNLIGVCSSAIEAIQFLQTENVDLIFLDIKMPKLSGIQFLKTITQNPKVILVTAYPEFAVEGFELSVVDYLLKPFSFERFLKAVQKAQSQILAEKQLEQLSSNKSSELMVKADKKVYLIPFQDIIYLKAYGDYVKVIRRQDKLLLTKETLSNIEKRLPSDLFIRVHRSYIVAYKAIQFLEGNHVKIQDQLIPVSAKAKSRILDRKEM